MDPQLRRPTTILGWLSYSLTPEQIQGLLDGCLCDTSLFPAVATEPRSLWALPRGDSMCMSSYDFLWEQGLSIHHIIPRSLGGLNHPSNYFLMPQKVNNYFGDR